MNALRNQKSLFAVFFTAVLFLAACGKDSDKKLSKENLPAPENKQQVQPTADPNAGLPLSGLNVVWQTIDCEADTWAKYRVEFRKEAGEYLYSTFSFDNAECTGNPRRTETGFKYQVGKKIRDDVTYEFDWSTGEGTYYDVLAYENQKGVEFVYFGDFYSEGVSENVGLTPNNRPSVYRGAGGKYMKMSKEKADKFETVK